MSNNNEVEQRIRERAFEIWIEEGQPDGKDKEHWERAEAEIIEQKTPEEQPAPEPLPGPFENLR
jgi:Protein of unknown function (DUF2934)